MPIIRRSSDRGRGLNTQIERSSSQMESLGRESAEKRVGIPLAPEIVDFVVELDNTYYKPEEPMCPTPSPNFSFKFTLTSSLYVEGEGLLHASLFENPEFESCGSFFYTREIQKRSWIPADLTYKLLSPTMLLFDSDIEDMYDGDAAAFDRGSSKPHNDPSATMSVAQGITTYSPTSPLLYSSPPAFSSPGSVDERDIAEITEVQEDCQRDSPVHPSFARHNKYAASRPSTSRAKKRRASAIPIPLSSTGAVRFPCRVPGCNQVCKTQGDLKRHENILAHKPPSWECRRCRYQFTREDALKRHHKNLPNCASAKTNPRGRFASVKRQYRESDVAGKIETTQN